MSLDGSQSTSIPIPFLAHDFVEHADGTLAAIAFEDRQDADGNRVRGNKLVEVAPDGTQRTVWTSWNCFDPVATPGDDPQQGWTFANALDYDPADGRLLRRHAQLQQHRQGQPRDRRLRMGARARTARRSRSRPAPPRFLHEHQFDVHGNHILVMDNDGAPGDESRVLEYELDFTDDARRRRSGATSRTRSVYTFVLGEPIRLADGGTFVNWSTAGQMERLDAGGHVDLEAEHGRGLRVRVPDARRPASTAGAARHESAQGDGHEASRAGSASAVLASCARSCSVAALPAPSDGGGTPGSRRRVRRRDGHGARPAPAAAARPATGGSTAGDAARPAGTAGTSRRAPAAAPTGRRRATGTGGATARRGGGGGAPRARGGTTGAAGRGGTTGAAGTTGRGGRGGSGGGSGRRRRRDGQPRAPARATRTSPASPSRCRRR